MGIKNRRRWTITDLDSEALWVIKRGLEEYAYYLEDTKRRAERSMKVKITSPDDNLKRAAALHNLIIGQLMGNPVGGTIDASWINGETEVIVNRK